MKRSETLLIMMGLLAAFSCPLAAQDDSTDNPRGNVHFGVPLAVPVGPTDPYTSFGVGAVAGAGYNFTRQHAAVGEFMWNRLFATDAAIDPIRQAMHSNSIGGSTDLFSITGNYRLELRGHTFGTYFIGGGGWYYRNQDLSGKITPGAGITCSPTWLWWGFKCSSGTVIPNQALSASGSSALGANGGMGFTIRVGDEPYRMYVESRYHYAPNKTIDTRLVTVTIGIRY